VLAADIYSTDTRFLFELIQNADDNSYADGRTFEPYVGAYASVAVVPRLSILQEPTYIWMTCNERGFTETDVRSLCEVRVLCYYLS
jgi:hypothetical protein